MTFSFSGCASLRSQSPRRSLLISRTIETANPISVRSEEGTSITEIVVTDQGEAEIEVQGMEGGTTGTGIVGVIESMTGIIGIGTETEAIGKGMVGTERGIDINIVHQTISSRYAVRPFEAIMKVAHMKT